MASEGSARIMCRFVLERDIESAAQDVREKVAGALRSLPPNMLRPVIAKADPDADPVISVVVAGDKSLRVTTEIADKKIKRVLETIDGVGEVTSTGTPGERGGDRGREGESPAQPCLQGCALVPLD